MTSKTKVIVTGASGFLGSHLCRSFNRKSIDYIGVSRKNGPMVDVVLNDYKDLLLTYNKNNILINLAGNTSNVSVKEYELVSELSDLYKNNMIFFSSSSVYGTYSPAKISEHALLMNNDEYAKSKISLEEKVMKNNGLVIRLASIYGIRMSQEKLFFNIFNQINSSSMNLRLKNINVIKDYLYIDDFCSAINSIVTKPIKNLVVNLGTGIGIESLKVIELICENLNKDFSKLKISTTDNTAIKNILNTDLFKKEYSWMPSINIENGIYKWIKDQRKK